MLNTEGILCRENTDCIKGIIKMLKRIKKIPEGMPHTSQTQPSHVCKSSVC